MNSQARRHQSIIFMSLALALVLLLSVVAFGQTNDVDSDEELQEGIDFINLFELDARLEPLYYYKMQEWIEEGVDKVPGFYAEIAGGDYVGYEGEQLPTVVQSFEGREGNILLWEEEESVIIWEIDIEQPGLYFLGLEYYPMPGRRASLMRDIRINGEYQFNEARRISFERIWRDAGLPKQDNQGNDVRPLQIESPEWRFKYIEDADGMNLYPFAFYLEEGVNQIELRNIREPMALEKIVVESVFEYPTYAEVLETYRENGYEEVQDAYIFFEAETPLKKSSPTVRAEFGSDPYVHPPAGANWRLNEFGAFRWRTGGEWAEWEFEIPESGLYQINIKRLQNWERMPSVREIRINGEIPFLELAELPFHHNKYWTNSILGTGMETGNEEDIEPFLFYFEEGTHTISMRVKVGRASETIRLLDRITKQLQGMGRAITYLVGPDPDPYMEWEVHRRIPDLLPTMTQIRDDLLEEAEKLRKYAVTRLDLAELFRLTADQIDQMMRDPYRLHTRIDDFSEMQSRLAHYLLHLRYAPLSLDYFIISNPGVELPRARANFLERLWYEVLGFVESFSTEYGMVGDIHDESEALDLWVAWGREWALIVKEMIEDDFTPATGITVNVNVIPAASATATGASLVLLSAASGHPPDLVFGADPALPVEFAIRGGIVDLTQFDDFHEVTGRFREHMLTPFTWQGGVFALPETQSFNMMFYRIDIMEEIAAETGVMEPETWQEVLEILPSLQQRGMNFNYTHGPGGFDPFLFQFGGDFYTEDGLRSALDTPEALQAFRFWTELYAHYKIDIQSDFYNRMRTGEMPIGIADYYTYVLLSTAAPELTGWWRMVPIPGIRKPDGTIDRSAGGTSTAGIIFQDSGKIEEAWELLKWWTSTDVQTRYAEELEALLGVEARWNTANVHAFSNLPWPRQDIEAILEQWEWFKQKPVVLGDYFTVRHIEFAWNMTVLDGRNPREALDIAVDQINRELIRKQEEFGIEVDDELRRALYRGYHR